MLNSENVCIVSKASNAQVTFVTKTTNENNQFSKQLKRKFNLLYVDLGKNEFDKINRLIDVLEKN